MIIYIDYSKKIVFIIPPKNGNNSIAEYLNISIHHSYDKNEIKNCLNDDNFIKLIIIRKNIIDRFLSGFYEDLFNNKCYNNIDISFTEYLLFLNHCYIHKIPKVDNLNVYLNDNISICFGNCSNKYLPITNDKGIFVSHIQSQKYSINSYLQYKNIKLLDIKDLDKFLNRSLHKNIKKKQYLDIDLYKIKLSTLKKERLIINKDVLNDYHKNIILNMYKEDTDFLEELEKKYEYIIL